MTLVDGQVQVRDLVLGCGTPYRVTEFDPWSRQVRDDAAGGARPWSGGTWYGAEFVDEAVVPWNVYIAAESQAEWLALHQELIAAFEPVGADALDVELRFGVAGSEFVMFGRPRMAQMDRGRMRVGKGRSWTSVAFVAPGGRIFSGEEQVELLGLPRFEGGLTWPVRWPLRWTGVLVDGRAELVNDGKADTPLHLRIDGPVPAPRLTVQHADGDVETLRLMFDLQAGQWVDIDTSAHTVMLQGTASRRGQVTGAFPVLRPGTSVIRFNAAEFNDQAQLTARWRSAW